MPALEDFAAALAEQTDSELCGLEMLPTRLAIASARALRVDGAGVSVTEHLRVPLGASNDSSTAAERLQTTTGTGPCLDAAAAGLSLTATEDEIQQRWPAFYHEFVGGTPFRSVLSTPLRTREGTPFGALDLYSREPLGVLRLDGPDAERVAAAVSDVLLADPILDISADGLGPSWLQAPPARTRMDLWAAIGMISAAEKVSEADAVALLRAAAYGRGVTIDQLAAELTTGGVPVEEVTGT